ncbi:MAG TPA: hypothetical protein VMS43_08520 [Allosphingosinicella sp.]|nr:hypothetical protein [Allosphingosinicella sp.]
MTFSYNAVWDDTGRLLKAHGPLLAAIAGVFVFLPTLLLGHFFPTPDLGAVDPALQAQVFRRFLKDSVMWYVLHSFIVMIGVAAMLRLALGPRTTVAGAIMFGGALLAPYSILVVLTNIIVFIGALLLIVPGLYLWARMLPAGAAMVAEDRRNPVDALKRSFALTSGSGWAVLGLLLLVAIPGMVLVLAVRMVSGILFILAAGQQTGTLLTEIVYCALVTIFIVILTMLSAAIYRALAGPDLKKPA